MHTTSQLKEMFLADSLEGNKPQTITVGKRPEREFDFITIGPVVEGQPVTIRRVKRAQAARSAIRSSCAE